MAKNDLFAQSDLVDATESAPSNNSGAGPAVSTGTEPHEAGSVPPADPSQPAADDPDQPSPGSPANPQIDQPTNIPGKLPDHGVENENGDVVKEATQKQHIHQALVYALRTAKELAVNVKEADTKYSQVAAELDTFLSGFTGKVESVQSDVPQGAGADAAYGDPGQRSFTKV